MRVGALVGDEGCQSEEPSWLDAARRRPAGWLVVLALTAYIAADKVWPHSDSDSLQFRQLEALQEDINGSSVVTTTSISTSSETINKPHDALLFLIIGLIVGTAVTFLTSFPLFHGVQQSVALFVIGWIFALILEGSLSKEHLGVMGSSFDMWMLIDPHLILFTLLPALLTGDAMNLDTRVARRVASQCVYLASSGVLCNTVLAALFLYAYLPYDWSFLQCMTTGAILCATDPVAVVALLKELGASPTLTVQIQGESLLNDGTAMVLYAISYSMLQGVKYDASEIMIYLLQKVALAVVIGTVVGYVFVLWIRNTNQLRHTHANMIQISLTICCAYWSFIISEGVLKINGVLATVFAALVLAHLMWPAIVNKESMHTVWHTLEYIGNTIIFFLAGALSGKSSVYVSWTDYFHVIVIWFILMVIRGTVLFLSRPVLKMLNETKQSVTPAESIVITWGGLRGALGLALAIQVQIDRAGGSMSKEDAGRVLFYVGGVAALTLVINATTCPMIVKKLGITRLEPAKRRMLLLMHRRLLELSGTKCDSIMVTRAINRMLVCTYQSINVHRRRRAIDNVKQKASLARSQTVDFVNNARSTARSTLRRTGTSIFKSSSETGAWTSQESSTRSRSVGRVRSFSKEERISSSKEEAGMCSVDSNEFKRSRESSKESAVRKEDAVVRISQCSGNGDSSEDVSTSSKEKVAWASGGAANNMGSVISDAGFVRKAVSIDESHTNHRFFASEAEGALRIRNGLEMSEASQCLESMRENPNGWKARITKLLKFEEMLDYVKVEEPDMQPMSHLLDEYAEVKMKFNMLPPHALELMGGIVDMPEMDMEQDHPLVSMLSACPVNEGLLRALNEGFFACLRSYYYKVMETGDLRPGSPEAEVLLNSIFLALNASYKDLLDFHFISPYMLKGDKVLQDTSCAVETGTMEAMDSVLPEWTHKQTSKAEKKGLHRFVESLPFQCVMIFAILVNAAWLAVEEKYLTSDNESHPGWLVAEITFCVIFLIECILKILDQRTRYFLDLWNLFDLMLVILGIAGLVFQVVALSLPVDSTQARVVRVARVFRVARLIRLFRLLRLVQGITAILLKQQGALLVQEHIKKITILTFYVKAQCLAQREYVNYFGNNGTVDTVEVARVILQSQVSVYKAISIAVGEEHLLNDQLMEQVNSVRESKALAEDLERFVMDAYKGGVVSHREADALLEPVREHIKACLEEIRSPVFKFAKQAKKTLQNGHVNMSAKSMSTLGIDFTHDQHGLEYHSEQSENLKADSDHLKTALDGSLRTSINTAARRHSHAEPSAAEQAANGFRRSNANHDLHRRPSNQGDFTSRLSRLSTMSSSSKSGEPKPPNFSRGLSQISCQQPEGRPTCLETRAKDRISEKEESDSD